MKAVILVGGKGKRLRPYTYVFPKPLLPINGKPILEIILTKLKNQGVNEIILATNYKSTLLEIFFSDGSDLGVDITYSKEENSLGTVGPLKLIEDKLDGDFIVMNGDVLTDLDIKKLIEYHKKNSSDITVVTKNMDIPLDYGMVKTDGDKVIGWREKPSLSSEISTGIYILNSSILKHIPQDKKYDMPDLIKKVIELNGNVLKFSYDGKWIDIGRIEDYKKVQNEELKQFEE